MARSFIKKWLLLSVVIIFDFLIALRTSIGFFYLLFWFLLFITLLSFIWILAEYFSVNLRLSRIMPSKIEEEDVLKIEAFIENRAPFAYFNLVLSDHLACMEGQNKKKYSLVGYLGPGSALRLKYDCPCPRRGKYNVGPFELYFFDPFGFFFLKKRYEIYSELYVYPQTFIIQKFPSLAKGAAPWFGIETSRVSGDEHEFYGTREYKHGDPMKRIHWLSTARSNRLIVRQFQRQSFFRATIIFNLEKEKNYGEGKESVVEYMIKIAASVAKYLLTQGVSVEIIAHAGEMVHMVFNKGPEHLEDIMRFLAVAQAESQVSFAQILQEFYRYIPNDSSLIIIMPDTDWECLPAMLSLERKNVSLFPLVIMSSSFSSIKCPDHKLKGGGVRSQQVFEFKPLFFCRGDNLSEVFLRC